MTNDSRNNAWADHWQHLREPVLKRWSRLRQDDVAGVGDRDALVDLLQARYGPTREEADARLLAFEEENADYARAVRKTSAGTAFTPRF